MIAALLVASSLAWTVPSSRPLTKARAEAVDDDFKSSMVQLGLADSLHIPAHKAEGLCSTLRLEDKTTGVAWHEMGFVRELLCRIDSPARNIDLRAAPKHTRPVKKANFPDLSGATARVLTTPYKEEAERVFTTPEPARRRR